MIAALHMAVLSFAFGPRHLGYILTAILSGTLILGGIFLLSGRKRRAGFIAGLVVWLAIQQVAYQIWKDELPGYWWALAQFAALQSLIAVGIGRNAMKTMQQCTLTKGKTRV